MARARDPRRFGAAEAVRKRLAAERRAGDARRRWRETESRALALARKLDRAAASRAAAMAATGRLLDQNGRDRRA
jgi:hypothetical protein